MSKLYRFQHRSNQNKTYSILVNNIQNSKNQIELDVEVFPPFGHKLILKRVKYNKENNIIQLNRGNGFQVSLTRSLRRKLTKICKEITGGNSGQSS